MENKLHDYRKLYQKHELVEENLPQNPFELFDIWLKEVQATKEVDEINAMTLATVGDNGFPKSRVVLLKEYDAEGFVFFTNYASEKGHDIKANPKVCLSFFWPLSERQVIIKGEAIKVSEEISEEYFHSRPRGSQLGALVSPQSSVIPSREFLQDKLQELEQTFEGKEIPKPETWGGYKVIPSQFEFWQGRPNRLHDRIVFSGESGNWKRNRLAP